VVVVLRAVQIRSDVDDSAWRRGLLRRSAADNAKRKGTKQRCAQSEVLHLGLSIVVVATP